MEEAIVIVLELVFVYPGAFIRWFLFYRKTKTFKEVLLDDLFKNSYVGLLTLGGLTGLIFTAIHYLKAG